MNDKQQRIPFFEPWESSMPHKASTKFFIQQFFDWKENKLLAEAKEMEHVLANKDPIECCIILKNL